MIDSTPIVSARHLRKSFGQFNALDDVSFDIQRGSIVGLIGPNGAGKTTTLKALLGLNSVEGALDVLGTDPRSGRHRLMEKVCFIADVGVLPRWMKVEEALSFVEGVHPRFNREKAETLLASTTVPKKKKIGQLSKGMVTQLHLSLVMAIDVELLVLDEPTIGLDILYRKEFYDRLVNDYFDYETSIVISTHQVEEIESLLTHLLFINQGRIVLNAAMDELPEIYSEVLIHPDRLGEAQALEPIYCRDMLGKKSMIFEGQPQDVLADLGEIHVPGVADLFVAKMQRGEV